MFDTNIKNRGFDNTIVFMEAPVSKKSSDVIYVDVYDSDNITKKMVQKNDLSILNRKYRGEGTIVVEVTVPSKSELLNNISGYFGGAGKADSGLENYFIKRVVLPEAYKEIQAIP